MANEFRDAMKNTADQIAKFVQDAATLTVETKYVEVGATSLDDAKPVARTIVKLDGDSEAVLPMKKNEAGVMEVDAAVFELHQQNVQMAIDYRAKILNALIVLFRGGGTTGSTGTPPPAAPGVG